MALDAETRDQLIDTVRRFVTERLRPLEAQVAEDDAMPDDVVEEMKGLGLFGLSIPEAYGGLDLTMEEECLVVIELGRTSPAFRSTFGTNVGIGSQALVMFGTEEQKAEVPARHRLGRDHHLLRPDRAGGRLGQRRGADPRDPRRRPLRAERRQALHHQRQQGRPVHGDGAHRSRDQAAAAASRPSWCRATCPASASASPRRRWASRAPTSAT